MIGQVGFSTLPTTIITFMSAGTCINNKNTHKVNNDYYFDRTNAIQDPQANDCKTTWCKMTDPYELY
jgi:hypothetical protein